MEPASKFNPLHYPHLPRAAFVARAASPWLEHAPFGMLLIDLLRPRFLVELVMSIVVLKLPNVKRETRDRPQHCRTYYPPLTLMCYSTARGRTLWSIGSTPAQAIPGRLVSQTAGFRRPCSEKWVNIEYDKIS